MKLFRLITLGVLFVGFLFFNYFALIPLNLRYTGTYFLFVIAVILILLLFTDYKKVFPQQEVIVNGRVVKTFGAPKNKAGIISSLIVLFILSFFVHAFSSTPIFFSKQYQQLIGEVDVQDFNKDFSAVDLEQLPIIDHKLAASLGDKTLGSIRGLGSEFHVGEFSDISINGKMALVAPLEYNGFFKWFNNKDQGTPGYIKVDKVTGKVELVQEVNGKKLGLKYLKSAFFNDKIERHTYFNGNMDNRLFKYSFELDDQGNPYWVAVKTHKTIGINGGEDVLSVITIDAQNGDVNEYKPSEAPSWIDMIYPSDLVIKQVNDWGLYVKGFFNSIIAQRDVILTTSGSRRVYNDGNVYHYTGLTSAGADESTVGFIFVNTRTKQATFYGITGATEEAAMASAEGKLQNLRYTAEFPIPLSIANEPTFFITMKDAKGLIKQYAFVNIQDYSIVSNGETIEKAYEQYLSMLGKENTIPDESKTQEIKGKVSRIGSSVVDGETKYYIVLENTEGLFYAPASTHGELAVTTTGDEVTLRVIGLKIVGFDNLNIK